MTDEDREIVAKLLKGRTMSVYALLLTHDSMGVREVQRMLGFSSPSLALHHLSKLSDLGLVTKDTHGDYSVVRTLRIGSLSLFVKVGKHLLPRFLFLVSFLTASIIVYCSLLLTWPPDGRDLMFIGVCVTALSISLYESRKLWTLSPF